jgi:hypothetical protein
LFGTSNGSTLRHYAFFRIPNSGDATSAIAAWMRNIGGSGGGDRAFENFGVGSTARDRAQKIHEAAFGVPNLGEELKKNITNSKKNINS